jgi:4-amino-4-deoxy-L-arabinose transferase-like glycosyltransferase
VSCANSNITAEVLGICTILVILLAMSAKPVFSKTWSGIFIWCLVPIVTLLFYHGNNGYIWDYYFTGIYPFIFLAIGGLMIQTWNRFMAARLLVGIFIFVFLSQNLPRTYHFLIAGTDGPNHVTLGSSQDAVDWVYKDTQNQPFNVDVYVPPVISYAYDYLFLWIGTTKYGHLPQAENIPNLYTLFEQDPPHPERLAAWLSRQSGIGKVVSEERFGGITSQKRVRIP